MRTGLEKVGSGFKAALVSDEVGEARPLLHDGGEQGGRLRLRVALPRPHHADERQHGLVQYHRYVVLHLHPRHQRVYLLHRLRTSAPFSASLSRRCEVRVCLHCLRSAHPCPLLSLPFPPLSTASLIPPPPCAHIPPLEPLYLPLTAFRTPPPNPSS